MRKFEKKSAEDLLNVLEEAHRQIKKAIKRKKFDEAARILEDCQSGAIHLGGFIERTEGEGFPTVSLLEEYCEAVYQLHEKLVQKEAINADGPHKQLSSIFAEILHSVKNDIKVRIEIVFLPYKASMWDSLESVWKAADQDPDCDAYVIPIPYYDKNPDESIRETHYEGTQYPDYVPITWYDEYNFEERRPDMIVIHNPYDQYNRVTSVFPFFYSSNLKKYTENLVYIPYFVVPGSIPEHFVLAQGVVSADFVFVQSPQIRKQYIDVLEREFFSGCRQMLAYKIISLGSPKTDKLLSMSSEKLMPAQWKKRVDGKKVVFFNTNVSLILNNGEYFIENLYRIFHVFAEYKQEFVLLWREHPLTMETLFSMRPDLAKGYLKIRAEFIKYEWGILDTTDEPHLAMSLSDCYYGAGGSLVTLYAVTGKPMMLTDYHYPKGISETEITKEDFYHSLGNRTYYKESNKNSLRIFLDHYHEIASFKEHRKKVISERLDNLDGTAGSKIYDHMKNKGENAL